MRVLSGGVLSILGAVLACNGDPPRIAAATTEPTWTGRVVDEQDRGIAGAFVLATEGDDFDVTDALRHAAVHSDASGRFSIAAPRDSTLIAGAEGRAAVALDTSTVLVMTDAVALGDVMLWPGHELRGEVVDEQGRPVRGARVVARVVAGPPNPGRWPQQEYGPLRSLRAATVSGNDGRFVLPCVARHGTALEVAARGHLRTELRPHEIGEPLRIELRTSGVVRGEVRGTDGRRTPAHVVLANGEEHPPWTGAPVLGDGRFEFDWDRHGVRWLQAWDDAGNRARLAVSGPRDDVVLELAPTRAVVVRSPRSLTSAWLSSERHAAAGRLLAQDAARRELTWVDVPEGPLFLEVALAARAPVPYALPLQRLGPFEPEAGEAIVLTEADFACGQVGGKVALPGVPPSRLAVEAITAANGLEGNPGIGPSPLPRGYLVPLDDEGRYRIEVPAGKVALRAVDLATCLPLALAPLELEVRAGETATRDLAPDCTAITLELTGPEIGADFVDSGLSMEFGGRIVRSRRSPGSTRRLEILLPKGALVLHVAAQRVSETSPERMHAAAARVAIVVAATRTVRVVMLDR